MPVEPRAVPQVCAAPLADEGERILINFSGYDGLHPDAWGEYLIANAFSKSLVANFGIGNSPLPIPDQNDPSLVRSIGTPSNFQVFTSPQGASATWDPGTIQASEL